MSEFKTVARVHDLPPDGKLVVTVDGLQIALFHSEGAFHALDNACPHRGGPLSAGFTEGGRVFCPLHGWAFELSSGRCFDRPDKPVRCYPLRVCNDEIQINTQFPKEI
jgi:NAD(P)H-dependent nitrite reductase small subunit